MNKEPANPILKKAIQQLPTYEPSTAIWLGLEQELNLQESIQNLPNHSPSEAIWNNIEQELKPKTNVTFWLKRWSIAAAILLLIGSYLVHTNTTKTIEKFTYQQEEIDLQLLATDWEEDAAAINQIENLCRIQQYLCTAPEFQSLQQELTELDQAKMALKIAIANYGKDVELIAQLSEIEMERANILKKMVANIL